MEVPEELHWEGPDSVQNGNIVVGATGPRQMFVSVMLEPRILTRTNTSIQPSPRFT